MSKLLQSVSHGRNIPTNPCPTSTNPFLEFSLNRIIFLEIHILLNTVFNSIIIMPKNMPISDKLSNINTAKYVLNEALNNTYAFNISITTTP